MNTVFAPGCGLALYKPAAAKGLAEFLERKFGGMAGHALCCRHEPDLERPALVINVCPGCDRRFRTLYEGISTVSLWEVLADDPSFPFPDYGGERMAILDACPTRDRPRIHEAVRALLVRMNIEAVEPKSTKSRGICCGDSFFGILTTPQVKDLMRKRASEMPARDVVVYCVSCVKAMHIGGRSARYLVDLLLGETTVPGTFEPEAWHRLLDRYIDEH